MNTVARIAILLITLSYSTTSIANPDRETLINAWEKRFAELPGTEEFEALGDDRYRIKDTNLPYEGELSIIGVLLQPIDSPELTTGFSTMGMVEFDLTELPAERKASQSYYYWLNARQMLYYSDEGQRWVDSQAYTQALSTRYEAPVSLGVMSFMLNYGIWILLIALVVFVFIGFKRQTGKAHALMDDSADINRKARENLDRSEAMQKEVLEITRESQQLHRETNRLLAEMLAKLQR
ncbi:MAG: hypothetical protein QNJ07_10285 [Woeseiaceae bacterium]|nr:hypothetical protein [Woeseiaceae bacterium]